MSTLDPNRFDWALVRSFLAVLDAGSLMGAARRLHRRNRHVLRSPRANVRARQPLQQAGQY